MPKVSRLTPYSGSDPIDPIATPMNSDISDMSRLPFEIASTLTSPMKVAAKNSGWSKVSAKRANGGEANVSSSALNRPPIALAVIAIVSARCAPSRREIG